MAELTPADVAQYTKNRLAHDDPETARLLSAGLKAARRFCGDWHVTYIEDDEVTMDGPGLELLVLPTLRLVTLTSIVENGDTEYLADDLYVSPRGMVSKRSGARWSGRFGSLTVTMTHGFDDADDFNAAVLSIVDRSSLTTTGGRPKIVGPFQYEPEKMAAGSAFSVAELSLLEQYRLESPA